MPILHRLSTIHNSADDRQTTAIETGRTCYWIGGLKAKTTEKHVHRDLEAGVKETDRLTAGDFCKDWLKDRNA